MQIRKKLLPTGVDTLGLLEIIILVFVHWSLRRRRLLRTLCDYNILKCPQFQSTVVLSVKNRNCP